jgi:hypothetical protein
MTFLNLGVAKKYWSHGDNKNTVFNLHSLVASGSLCLGCEELPGNKTLDMALE